MRVAFADPPVKFYDSSTVVPPIETVTDTRYLGDTFGTVDTYVRGTAASYANVGIAALNAGTFYRDASRHVLTHVGPFSDVDVDFLGTAVVAPAQTISALPGAATDLVAGIRAARSIRGAEAAPAADATMASVIEKAKRYFLNPDHTLGKEKAAWFKSALGFDLSNSEGLTSQIVFDPASALETEVTEYGTKYNQVIPIVGTNGRTINVTFAWIREESGLVRLITAIPPKK